MSGVRELYREFRQGLDTTPGPEDPTFFELWSLYMDITDNVSARLTEPQMGSEFDAAERVQVFLAWSEHVGKICREMPLRVPSPALRAVKAAGRYLDRTPLVDELAEFLRLGSPMVNDLSEYAVEGLGRHARPVVDELSFVSRAGTLMYESVSRTIPGMEVRL
ncbi:hypothetical protein ACFWHR_12170 [Leucobacter sp. NPDC058333]|uniref:hypothetical protein n=1 Tax=Leucobacter sp. NPDC058333 TaxID=3346450 RepID=UPI003650A3E6